MQLSSMPMKSPLSSLSADSFIFPTTVANIPGEDRASIAPSIASVLTTDSATDLSASTATISSADTAAPVIRAGRRASFHPSGLSLQLARQSGSELVSSGESLETPTAERPFPRHEPIQRPPSAGHRQSSDQDTRSRQSESTPLLGDVEAAQPAYNGNGNGHASSHLPVEAVGKRTSRGKLVGWGKRVRPDAIQHIATAGRAVPAVILGTLLNILDGISCKPSSNPTISLLTSTL